MKQYGKTAAISKREREREQKSATPKLVRSFGSPLPFGDIALRLVYPFNRSNRRYMLLVRFNHILCKGSTLNSRTLSLTEILLYGMLVHMFTFTSCASISRYDALSV